MIGAMAKIVIHVTTAPVETILLKTERTTYVVIHWATK